MARNYFEGWHVSCHFLPHGLGCAAKPRPSAICAFNEIAQVDKTGQYLSRLSWMPKYSEVLPYASADCLSSLVNREPGLWFAMKG